MLASATVRYSSVAMRPSPGKRHMARRGDAGRPDPLDGSLFLLESAMLDHGRAGVSRASLEAGNAVAAAYWRSGRFTEARTLLERTVGDCRTMLGSCDPDSLIV